MTRPTPSIQAPRRSIASIAQLEQRIVELESHYNLNPKLGPEHEGLTQDSKNQRARSSVANDLQEELESFEEMYNSLELRIHDVEKEIDSRARAEAPVMDRLRRVQESNDRIRAMSAATEKRVAQIEAMMKPFEAYSAGILRSIEQLSKLQESMQDWTRAKHMLNIKKKLESHEKNIRDVSSQVSDLKSCTSALQEIHSTATRSQKSQPSTQLARPQAKGTIGKRKRGGEFTTDITSAVTLSPAVSTPNTNLEGKPAAPLNSERPRRRRTRMATDLIAARPRQGHTATRKSVKQKHSDDSAGTEPATKLKDGVLNADDGVRRTSRSIRPTERHEEYVRWQKSIRRRSRKSGVR